MFQRFKNVFVTSMVYLRTVGCMLCLFCADFVSEPRCTLENILALC